MAWNTSEKATQRALFVRAVLAKSNSKAALCREFKITRPTGDLWLRRHAEHGASALADRLGGRPPGRHGLRRERWEELVLALRHRHPTWGALKLYARLRQQEPRARLPSARTIDRLLVEHDLRKVRRRRPTPGPVLPRPRQIAARRCHDVWTVDFKGHFRTGDGRVCYPLTVRDLRSRYLLLVEPLPDLHGARVRQAMARCFRVHGVPRCIRVDNGGPFAGEGPLRLSRLSAWWWRLGIQVDFTRPAKPQDNGAHEQMHRVLKAEAATPPSATWREQVQRLRKFHRYYNEERPHQALGQKQPALFYEPNARGCPKLAVLRYPAGWTTLRVGRNGRVSWGGQQRRIGHAFGGEMVGLKPKAVQGAEEAGAIVEVYWGTQLVGELRRHDLQDLHPAQYQPRKAKPR